jgi:hypothetical protein
MARKQAVHHEETMNPGIGVSSWLPGFLIDLLERPESA